MIRQRLLERFLKYAKIDTTADDTADRYPSSDGQRKLGRMLVDELVAMGVEEVEQNEHGLVIATIPGNTSQSLPIVALNAHLDTSPETSGTNVKPNVIVDYSGGDIQLPGADDAVIRVADSPELNELVGNTIITSDGTTLLGADDKAGVAIIMEVADSLCSTPPEDRFAHGPIRVLFTCDEEIGRGVDYVDVPQLQANVCYTLDGPAAGHIDVETFSADLAVIEIRGINIHPSIAKGRMVNAMKVAAAIIDRLPAHRSPESTSEREGFLHPYSIEGGVANVRLRILVRDFDSTALTDYANQLRAVIHETQQEFPNSDIHMKVTTQYRNLADGLRAEPRAVAFAEEAFRRLGRKSFRSIIRGGTDGSRLTELGLPTPNLSSGQHNPHSPHEWACLEEMEQAAEVTLEILRVWGESC